jgi:hypothetical protein
VDVHCPIAVLQRVAPQSVPREPWSASDHLVLAVEIDVVADVVAELDTVRGDEPVVVQQARG